jgi:hypothetical protein
MRHSSERADDIGKLSMRILQRLHECGFAEQKMIIIGDDWFGLFLEEESSQNATEQPIESRSFFTETIWFLLNAIALFRSNSPLRRRSGAAVW